jgi:hypothetical protein
MDDGENEAEMIGITSFRKEFGPPPPRLNRKRAMQVIAEVDAILAWDAKVERERDVRFLALGQSLCEIRSRQYWRAEGLKSFDEFLEKRFHGSRRRAYYLMSIQERLPKQTHPRLPSIGWSKSIELAKVARRHGKRFDSEKWLRRAQELPKERFKQAVEKELSGRDEHYEMVTFKLYDSQLHVVEQALESAAMLLGSDRSRGYCLEMICADFLAGSNQQDGNEQALLLGLESTFRLLPPAQQLSFLRSLGATATTAHGGEEAA